MMEVNNQSHILRGEEFGAAEIIRALLGISTLTEVLRGPPHPFSDTVFTLPLMSRKGSVTRVYL